MSDLVSYEVTDTIALCEAMIFQIFPDVDVFAAAVYIFTDTVKHHPEISENTYFYR